MFLEKIDFAKMYQEHKKATNFKGKNSKDWDEKSKDMATTALNSPYVNDFISRMELTGDEVILDIGCGPGTLAVPLAKKVKKVIAIDFSEKMLEELKEYAKKEGANNIDTYLLSWEDDWSILPKVDIVVASRSIEVQDIDIALTKISSQATKACYVTYKAGGSFVDMNILDYIGKKIVTKPDFWYIPILLYKKGYLPHVDYIDTQRASVNYSSVDEFISSLIWSVHELDETQQLKAREYYEKFIAKKNRLPKPFTWAFISWKIN